MLSTLNNVEVPKAQVHVEHGEPPDPRKLNMPKLNIVEAVQSKENTDSLRKWNMKAKWSFAAAWEHGGIVWQKADASAEEAWAEWKGTSPQDKANVMFIEPDYSRAELHCESFELATHQ